MYYPLTTIVDGLNKNMNELPEPAPVVADATLQHLPSDLQAVHESDLIPQLRNEHSKPLINT